MSGGRPDHRAFKEQLYAQFARIGKALASPQRLELLDLLSQGERTVEALAHEANLSVANASQHLRVLYASHLVETRKDGLYVYYRLADLAVYMLWRDVQSLGERQLAEIERLVETYMRQPRQLEPVMRADLLRRMATGEAVVLDVRPVAEYAQGHIANARSIPITELAQRLSELPRDQEIVAYCRGPYCLFADEAVALLAARGYQARRLEEGFPEWRAATLPIEMGIPS